MTGCAAIKYGNILSMMLYLTKTKKKRDIYNSSINILDTCSAFDPLKIFILKDITISYNRD